LVRLAIITAIVAASATAAHADSQPCTKTLDGHVVDAATHEPVAGAVVSIDGRPVTQTDADGRFSAVACPPAVVEVERADYAPGRRVVTSGSVEIELELAAGEVIVVEGEAPAPIEMQATAVVSGEALERTRGKAFADTLAEVPGVAPLRSASGMAKPIVRGQFGRRLLILVDSVRHRSQEWGLDHAPEVDPFVADRLTVVRGAAGVRYGPDAIGGAVLVDPPALLAEPGVAGEVHLVGTGPSNGRGGSLAARVQAAPSRVRGLAGQLHGSLKRLAAPTTPDYPLDNTGTDEWNLGATVGYRRGDAEYRVSYLRYQAALGVCSCLRIESSEDFFAQLERERPADADLYRSDFELERPYQAVAHDLGLARGTWSLGRGTLSATYALQYDHRREYDVVRDATTGPQFDFRLTTHDADVGFEHDPVHLSDHLHLRGAAGVVGMAQVHAYGGLPLVPDHQAWSTGAYLIERISGHDFEVEAGLRYDLLTRTASIVRQDFLRLVRSGQLAEDACGAAEADPVDCASTYHTVSASIGALRQLTHAWALKADLSTASRPPNPDEQYMNGTSPTFPVLGLGKPDLGAETTYSASVTTTYQGERVAAEASAYANHIDDYIYFAPALDENGDPIFDVLVRGAFPRFVTRPVDAVFYGADGGIAVKPVPSLELGAQVSVVRARNRTDDSYLVFVPPDRARASATYTRAGLWGLREAFVSLSGVHVARQKRFDLAADFAPPPDAYTLLGGELGIETGVDDQTIEVALQGTNLLNARYRDYTSLLRYFVDQPGWQLMLRLSVHFEE
jgi:iron complex outermembrane receptor protein